MTSDVTAYAVAGASGLAGGWNDSRLHYFTAVNCLWLDSTFERIISRAISQSGLFTGPLSRNPFPAFRWPWLYFYCSLIMPYLYGMSNLVLAILPYHDFDCFAEQYARWYSCPLRDGSQFLDQLLVYPRRISHQICRRHPQRLSRDLPLVPFLLFGIQQKLNARS